MASDTKNVKLGVCKVFFDGVDLGYTKGGVEVSVTTETHKVEVDQFGKSVINEYVMGRQLTVKCPLAETTLTNMATLFPGTSVAGTTKFRAAVKSGIGTDLLASAKLLVLHPIKTSDPTDIDYTEDFTVLFANTPGALTYAYKLDDERIFDAEFTGYPDPVAGDLFIAGNPFTDAAGVTRTFTTTGTTTVTTTGLATTDTGRSVVVATLSGGASDALPSGLSARKKYYMRYLTATTCTLHPTKDDALNNTNAISTGSAGTGTHSMAFLN